MLSSGNRVVCTVASFRAQEGFGRVGPVLGGACWSVLLALLQGHCVAAALSAQGEALKDRCFWCCVWLAFLYSTQGDGSWK